MKLTVRFGGSVGVDLDNKNKVYPHCNKEREQEQP